MGDCTDCVHGICGGLSWRKWRGSEITIPAERSSSSNFNPCLDMVARVRLPLQSLAACVTEKLGQVQALLVSVCSWPLKALVNIAEFGAWKASKIIFNFFVLRNISRISSPEMKHRDQILKNIRQLQIRYWLSEILNLITFKCVNCKWIYTHKTNSHKFKLKQRADKQFVSGIVLYSHKPDIWSAGGLPLILVLNTYSYYLQFRKW